MAFVEALGIRQSIEEHLELQPIAVLQELASIRLQIETLQPHVLRNSSTRRKNRAKISVRSVDRLLCTKLVQTRGTALWLTAFDACTLSKSGEGFATGTKDMHFVLLSATISAMRVFIVHVACLCLWLGIQVPCCKPIIWDNHVSYGGLA